MSSSNDSKQEMYYIEVEFRGCNKTKPKSSSIKRNVENIEQEWKSFVSFMKRQLKCKNGEMYKIECVNNNNNVIINNHQQFQECINNWLTNDGGLLNNYKSRCKFVVSLVKEEHGMKKVNIFLDGLGNDNQFRYQLILDNAFGLSEKNENEKEEYWNKQYQRLTSFINEKTGMASNDEDAKHDNNSNNTNNNNNSSIFGVEREDFKKLDRLSMTEYLEKAENNQLLIKDNLVGIDAACDLENEYESDDSTKGTECCVFVKQSNKDKRKMKFFKIELKSKNSECRWKPSSNDINNIDWGKEYDALKQFVCQQFGIECIKSLILTIDEYIDEDDAWDDDAETEQEAFDCDELQNEWITLMEDENAQFSVINAAIKQNENSKNSSNNVKSQIDLTNETDNKQEQKEEIVSKISNDKQQQAPLQKQIDLQTLLYQMQELDKQFEDRAINHTQETTRRLDDELDFLLNNVKQRQECMTMMTTAAMTNKMAFEKWKMICDSFFDNLLSLLTKEGGYSQGSMIYSWINMCKMAMLKYFLLVFSKHECGQWKKDSIEIDVFSSMLY